MIHSPRDNRFQIAGHGRSKRSEGKRSNRLHRRAPRDLQRGGSRGTGKRATFHLPQWSWRPTPLRARKEIPRRFDRHAAPHRSAIRSCLHSHMGSVENPWWFQPANLFLVLYCPIRCFGKTESTFQAAVFAASLGALTNSFFLP